MAGSDLSFVDWLAIEAEYELARSYCVPFKIATVDQIERAKLSKMTHNAVQGDFIEEWQSDYYIVVHDADKRERLKYMADFFGFPDNKHDELLDHRDGQPTVWARIKEGIAQRKMTSAFLQDWSLLQFNLGAYIELYRGNERNYKMKFRQCLTAMDDNTFIQRHWYAHWLIANTAPGTKKAERFDEARISLAEVVSGVSKGKLLPCKPYSAEWYAKMLEDCKSIRNYSHKFGDQLKSTYTKISVTEIYRMVEDPIITRDALPPLAVNQFARTKKSDP